MRYAINPRLHYTLTRIVQMLPTLFLILLSAFMLLHLAPGDPAQILAGESGGGDAAYLAMLRRNFGLDQPLYVQFFLYAKNVLIGELGFSFRNNMPVLELIGARLVPTLLLSGTALLLAVVLGMTGGAVAAAYRGTAIDRGLSALALLIYATPGFLLGLGLMILFAVSLPWFPIGGFMDTHGLESRMDYVASVARHLVLPAVTLGALYAAIYMRFTRGAMLEIYGQDHVRTARSKGLSRFRITRRHVLRNAMLPLVTVVGLQAGSLLSGTILVETVFSWPGLGRLAFEAVQQRDYNLLSALILCTGALVVVINLIVDLLYAVLDPRLVLR
ncbi:ABC transporter permease [Agrobacterium tumefaciens]|uniref:ABC transporter permease n=2 Tax=Agrobacterium tumefaciens TaxID=358 RepID=A0AA44J9I3_AGRTU|nr:ABC transporter permease [Agrobacterium tumefaciens]NSL21323.1 ABC transporter permease [Agrobacterium tumefaciens]NTB83895.1 ABC transporter permease [Agrobacterium tumefaciens]NTC20636.1 ABC transporter permease [Agrobacterium tumefaciens]NTC29366.1 ABC transporter permease [Agrobacterium tumefaciens]NTC57862.1 ABC transporter permease [Agrobacterium tumefaciens]